MIRLAFAIGLFCSLHTHIWAYSVSTSGTDILPSVTIPANLQVSDRSALPVAFELPRHFPTDTSGLKFDVEAYQPDNPRHLLDQALGDGDRGSGGLGPCKSFSGATYTGWDPPDPQIAVGPNHIVEVVNSAISVFDKNTGNLLLSASAQFWFAGVQPAPPSTFIYDPKVIYDRVSGRFVLLFLCTDGVEKAAFLLSASQTSSPLGNWWSYCLDATLNGASPSGSWPDYPGLACDYDEAVYLSANMWDFAGTYMYPKVRIIPKNRLYSGMSLTYSDIWDIRYHNAMAAFAVKPATMTSDANGMFLWSNQWAGGDYVTYWKITNPLSTPVLTIRPKVNVAAYSMPPNAAQMGGSSIGMIGPMTQDVIFRNGKLYSAFDQAFNWGGGAVAAIRLLGIDTTISSAVVDYVIGGPGKHYYLPNIYVDADNRIFAAFNRSGADEYVGVHYIENLSGDVRSRPLKNGEGPRGGSAPVRWGDHCGISGDPNDASKVWMCGEYNTSSPFHWGTWIGNLPSGVPSPAVATPAPGSGQKPPVKLAWDPELPAESYSLQIDDDSSFASPQISVVVDTNVYVAANLSVGTVYFWRVRGMTACPDNPWSNTFSFKACSRQPGDVDGNGIVTISDAVYLITFIFSNGPMPTPQEAGDSDCNAIVNVSDAVRVIGYIFSSGVAPCGPC